MKQIILSIDHEIIEAILENNLMTSFMNLLISPAYAQAAGSSSGVAQLVSFAPFILIFVVFYFLLIRPQQTRAKQLRNQLKMLRRGDKIITAGGLIGKVIKNQEDSQEMEVEIAPNIRVNVLRSTVTTVLESKALQVDESKKENKKS